MLALVEIIEEKLRDAFTPELLKIVDESYKHAGHNPAARQGGTHFHITIVAACFQGMPRIRRHQEVYKVLKEEMQGPIHALALKILAPGEKQ